MMSRKITLTGDALTLEDIAAVTRVDDIEVIIAESCIAEAKRAQAFLDKNFNEKIIYGVNTGFGPMASHILGRDELVELQKNLVRSHAAGMGNPLPSEYVLAAMVVRLNTLAKGKSGVSPELLKQLQNFINQRIIPIVPEHGAVGTSGDLVQLAHIALALIGEGEVMHRGERKKTADVLRSLNIKPYELKPKEGLSLINGTSMMAGIDALLCVQAKQLLGLSVRLGALALELTGGFDDSISETLHALRPHVGQGIIAERLRTILASSKLLRNRKTFQQEAGAINQSRIIPEGVQEVYSLRCIPQIVGPVFDIFKKVWGEVTIEVNAVTDNPILDIEHEAFLHGGNFHGDYMAAAIDQLKISIVKLTMLSERRINFFMNANINKIFPPFMNLKKPGLTLGLQGLQFVATSTTARSQTLAFPQHIHSIPTNADNQDVVSMGTDAALIAAEVIENAFTVFTIESLALSQGVAFTKDDASLSEDSRHFINALRDVMPVLVEDRNISGELASLMEFLKTYQSLF